MSTKNSGVEEDEESNGCKVNKTSNFPQVSSLNSSSLDLQQVPSERDKFSSTIPSRTSNGFQERFFKLISRKLDRGVLEKMAKEWIKNPMNMALIIWMLCVTISGAILFLIMTGLLNHALPRKNQRETWSEVNIQILNALFTLICLYHHPRRLHHLLLLLRSKDVSNLRKLYCKNGTCKPHERKHMLIVVFLLNLNCFAQYALCGLTVGYPKSKRPAIGVAITISVAIAAPAIAGVYTIVSPLGKDYETGSDQESQIEKRSSFSSSGSNPKWNGGVFDIWEDIWVSYLSLFCGFCVFGWNMERLGFGNMYVHTATFVLFCLAPFLVFSMAAINIKNEIVREGLGITGVFLCVMGLLYGGFWRIQMRKRYNLPPNSSKICCGKPDVSDCASWLFCCWCSLAQEVRTANSNEIVEDRARQPSDVEEDSSLGGKDETLEPPIQSFISREGN